MTDTAASSKRLYWTGWWRFGSYNIGSTKVLMLGPIRWFCRDASRTEKER